MSDVSNTPVTQSDGVAGQYVRPEIWEIRLEIRTPDDQLLTVTRSARKDATAPLIGYLLREAQSRALAELAEKGYLQ